MKKVFFVLALFIFFRNYLNSQVFKVGDVNCNYKPINYNFNAFCPQYNSASDTYSLDIDADLNSEINITSSCQWNYYPSLPGWVNVRQISLFPGANCQLVWDGMGGIKNQNYGTVLNNGLNWTNSSGYLFNQVNPYYVGFRKILAGDTLYGWISIDFSSFPGAINSLAYKKTSDTLTATTAAFTNTTNTVCKGDSLKLTAVPAGGQFIGIGVSGNSFYSASVNVGTSIIYYNPTPGSGNCSNNATFSVTVNSCVGVKEINPEVSSFKIFPNPNNGEFEIKGTKEETIYITNELGQAFESKNLNSQNNYSVKINNLQNGIYFVGNRFSKQKIVVIR